jgi:hypothetical protein
VFNISVGPFGGQKVKEELVQHIHLSGVTVVQAIIGHPMPIDATNVQVVGVQNGCIQSALFQYLENQVVLMLEVVPVVLDRGFVIIGRAANPRLHAIEAIVGLSKVRASIIPISGIIRSIAARVARDGRPPEKVTAPAQLLAGGSPFVQHADRLSHAGGELRVAGIVRTPI